MNSPEVGDYPRPHEGITGTERTEDDLLSLAPEAIARRLMMAGLAGTLYEATMNYPRSPDMRLLTERMRDPRPGDLVMELSTRLQLPAGEQQTTGFGILLARRTEWVHDEVEWAEYTAGAANTDQWIRPRETVWYIQYGPTAKHVYRWENADFVAVPVGQPRLAFAGSGLSVFEFLGGNA